MNKEPEMTEEQKSYAEKMKPHMDGLFSGKYDLVVKNDEEKSSINLTEIIRLVVLTQRNASQKIMEIEDMIKTTDLPRKKTMEQID